VHPRAKKTHEQHGHASSAVSDAGKALTPSSFRSATSVSIILKPKTKADTIFNAMDNLQDDDDDQTVSEGDKRGPSVKQLVR